MEIKPKMIEATTASCDAQVTKARVKLDEYTATLAQIKLEGKHVKK
jgi:hypothetical protein